MQTCDSLLLAIDEEYVEGVELLLEHEGRIWKVIESHLVKNLYVSKRQFVRLELSTPGRSRTP